MVHTEEIIAWLGPGQEDILWLHGFPGTGKSTMSIFLAEKLSAKAPGTSIKKTVSYFFCDSGKPQRNTATLVIRGLLYQLFKHHPPLLKHFWSKYDERGQYIYESFDALWQIFMAAAADQQTGRKYFIIDALDECDQDSQNTLLRQFEESFSNLNKANSNIRILVTSRPYPEIKRYLKGFANKDLASYPQRKQDIELYIEDKVKDLANKNSYTPKVRDQVRTLLRENAGGTFLWVGLVCEQLGQTASKKAVQVLKGLPPGLPSLYGKLLNAALEQQGEIVVRILKLVAVSLRPLSVLELSEICQLNVDEEDLATRELYTRDDIESCRLMVIIQDGKVLLLHKSVRDHLSQAGHLDELDTHAELAYRCIDLVIKPPAYSSNYAIENWPRHARMAQSKFAVQISQTQFFEIYSPCREKWLDEIRRSFGTHLPRNLSLLHIAAEWGLSTLARHVYSQAKQMNCLDISSHLCDGVTPFELAVQSRDASIEVISVLLDEFDEKVTTRVLEAAARNRGNGEEVIKFLLVRLGDQITVTKDVVIAAGENWENGEGVMKLLLEYRGDQIKIDEEVVIAAAANRGNAKGVFKVLLDYQDQIIITEEVVKAAAGNRWNAVVLMTLLLDRRTDQVKITEEVLIAAAGNWGSGEGVLNLLFDYLGDEIEVTEDVLISAAGNWANGEAVMKLLLRRRGAQVMVTEEVLKATVSNRGNKEALVKLLLGHLLDHQGQITITDEVFWKAPAGTLNHSEVTKLLQGHI
ncbi:hypothetical protein BDV27DRAFT_91676 [Aspergillus caelatus]|uniref:Nephrocystin 3-like N-terminal domain-containing protein n=1 Tax=Aspergillus caelatus TaxID=61420 RepID=A0A5N7AB80_9EURO|nr:uncharacterized protein BDV27DRAFT_91676 [Aspergillus caelatus]KAE8366416.1 hypothetical protein BDV27DRAFT_91676 [Aspergillus caelatus]